MKGGTGGLGIDIPVGLWVKMDIVLLNILKYINVVNKIYSNVFFRLSFI